MDNASPTILIVDDESSLAELYAHWLENEYEVRTAIGGMDALNQLDEDIDVVLLDRKMPDLSGDEVLTEIREREIDCRVAMVTGVKPDIDIIGLEFDEYLTKSVSKDELHTVVEAMLARGDYERPLQEYFALVSKRAVLHGNMGTDWNDSRDESEELNARIAELEHQLEDRLAEITNGDFEAVYNTFSRLVRAPRPLTTKRDTA